MNNIQTNTVLIFKHICNFVKDLNSSFGGGNKPLMYYTHIIEETGIMHEEPMKKHITLFLDYLKKNENAILENDETLLSQDNIVYSEKIYIDVKNVFSIADESDKKEIWKHLMTLLAIMDPSSEAKKILKAQQEEKTQKGVPVNEEKFLNDMISKVGEFVRPDSDPNQMFTNILQSGIVNNLVENMTNGINEGELDMNNMMNTVQKMMTSLGGLMNQQASSSL